MKLSKELHEFCNRLEYRFKDTNLLMEAITHGSAGSSTRPDNQRLEFLGDRVLGLVISEALLIEDPDAKEGQLAPRYNALVRKECCASVADDIRLGDVLKLGRSEQLSGGRRKRALLGDGMEALIAATYLDGGFFEAKALILRLWKDRIKNVDLDAKDAKTRLQEWAQARAFPPPEYVELKREGPDHAPRFTIEARLKNGTHAHAIATSKREAEQEAASSLLQAVERHGNG